MDTVRGPISDLDGAQDTVTEPSPSQTEPTEPAEGKQDAPAAGGGQAAPQGKQPPRWSDHQPEPAPWYLGRPGGAVKPGQGGQGPGPNPGPSGWGAPPRDTPPNDRPPQPSQGSGTQQGGADGGGPTRGQHGEVPAWTGRMPERGAPPGQSGPGQGGRPGPGAGQSQGPGNAPQNRPSPWHDPNRYGPPQQQRPDPSGQGRPRPGAPAEPRGPLDLRTRWARGLALGATACMLIALWYAYANISAFPSFLISAAVALVLALAGLWFGVFAQRAAMRQNKRAPEAVGAIVWSSIAAFISLMILAYSLVFYAQLNQYAQCMRSATTIALENKCVSDYENSYGGRN